MFLAYLSGRLRPLRNMNGQALVEFALAVTVFFVTMFAVIDFGMMLYVNLTMQHAVCEGTRYAITGQANGQPNPTGAQRRAAMIQKIKAASSGLYDKNLNAQRDPVINVITAGSVTFTNYSGTPKSDTGKPNDILEVRLTYSWPLMTPFLKHFFTNGRYTFTVKSTMKNEPYLTS